jgi:hypothetical protein
MAALIRGLFEYLYRADALTIVPHIPTGITRLEQDFPIRFGVKRIYLATTGQGPVTAVMVNGKPWSQFDQHTIQLPYDALPDTAHIDIALGGAASGASPLPAEPAKTTRDKLSADAMAALPKDEQLVKRVAAFLKGMEGEGLGETYEARHARLALDAIAVIPERQRMEAAGKLAPLPEPTKSAADQLYVNTALKLCQGLDRVLRSYEKAGDPRNAPLYQMWVAGK